MILNKKLKKAQIGLTFSWFVAFIVVAVIMLIFIISVVFIAGAKKSADYDNLELEVGGSLKKLENQRKIEYILNSPTKDLDGNEIQLKDLIGLWFNDREAYEGVLKKDIKGLLDEMEYLYYNYEKSRWEINVNALSITRVPSNSEESLFIVGSTKYERLGGMNRGFVRKQNKDYVDPTSQESYFSLSTGTHVRLTLSTRTPTENTF